MTGAGTAPVSEAGWWLERACSPTSRRTAAPERSARGARHSLSAPFRAVPHETTIAGLRPRDRQGSSGAALHRALPGRRRSQVPAGQPLSGEFQVSVVRYDAAIPPALGQRAKRLRFVSLTDRGRSNSGFVLGALASDPQLAREPRVAILRQAEPGAPAFRGSCPVRSTAHSAPASTLRPSSAPSCAVMTPTC